VETKIDLWNVVYLEYTWQRGQCWCFYDKQSVSVKRPDICETELLSPAEKENWISLYLNCKQHSSYNTVSQEFTHSLTQLFSHSLTYTITDLFSHLLTHPHTQVDIQYIINPKNYSRHGCLSEIINKTMKHSPCWKGTIVQLVKKTLRFDETRSILSLQPRTVYGT
jgi:hypothetical protein